MRERCEVTSIISKIQICQVLMGYTDLPRYFDLNGMWQNTKSDPEICR